MVVALLVPWGAYHGARTLARRAMPPRASFLVSLVLQQVALAWFALWVAGHEYILLAWRVGHPVRDAALGVLLTGTMIAAARPLWREAVRRRERRAYLTMPRTAPERVLWIAVSLAAGVAEEVAYRAVLFALLLRILGGPVPAALAGAACFGLAHLVQGWKSVADRRRGGAGPAGAGLGHRRPGGGDGGARRLRRGRRLRLWLVRRAIRAIPSRGFPRRAVSCMPNQSGSPAGTRWTIVPLRDDTDAEACARIMATSEPWITLGRDYDKSLAIVRTDAAGRLRRARSRRERSPASSCCRWKGRSPDTCGASRCGSTAARSGWGRRS